MARVLSSMHVKHTRYLLRDMTCGHLACICFTQTKVPEKHAGADLHLHGHFAHLLCHGGHPFFFFYEGAGGMCVYVCVRERVREGERARAREPQRCMVHDAVCSPAADSITRSQTTCLLHLCCCACLHRTWLWHVRLADEWQKRIACFN